MRPRRRPLHDPAKEVPQIRDSAARRGGWNIPYLTPGPARGLPRWAWAVAGVLALVLVIVLLRALVGCVAAGLATGGQEQGSSDAATAAQQEAGSGDAGDATSAAATTDAVTTAAATTDAARPASAEASADGSTPAYTTLDAGRTTASGEGRLSFSAVGDNLMNENLLALADGWAGTAGDGSYDFSPFYSEVSAYVQNSCDVSFINQETVLGGTDTYGYMGYPSYNTPDSLADAVADAGWRVVNLNTNHTYDIWTEGIEHALDVWAGHTGLITTGSYASEDARQTVRMVECNGIRLAVLAYSYGQNGYEQSDLPNSYYAVPWDAGTMQEDVARARTVADVVVVYAHAGDEYTNDPSDYQREIAQACADAGVDLMIGSHAHVIQPCAWIERSGGGTMLAVYGLGDFVSGYTEYPEVVLSGMFSCDFVRVSEEVATGDNVGPGGIAIENATWHPLIEHMEGETDVVRFVKGYTGEEARANELLATLDDPLTWLVEETREVVGDAVAIDV